MEMNKMVYDLQLTKTISSALGLNAKVWEQEGFKAEQKRARNDATRHYDLVVEKIILMIEVNFKFHFIN